MTQQVRKQMASAYCGTCLDQIKSTRPGDFVRCSCGSSFVDTDRWDAAGHRYGGEAKPDDQGHYWVYTPGARDTHMEEYELKNQGESK